MLRFRLEADRLEESDRWEEDRGGRARRRREAGKEVEEEEENFWFVGFLTYSSTTRLYRGWAPKTDAIF